MQLLEARSFFKSMHSLGLFFLISLAMSHFLSPITAYILPLPFHSSLTSYNVDLQGYHSDSEAHDLHDFPAIRPDPSDERDDVGRIISFKSCYLNINKIEDTSSFEIDFIRFSFLILDSSASAVLEELIKEEHELIEKAEKTLKAANAFLADIKKNENALTGKVYDDM